MFKCKLTEHQLPFTYTELLNMFVELVFSSFLYYFKYDSKFRTQIFGCI